MKTNMGLNFWKMQLMKKFGLNQVGRDILNILCDANPRRATEYILDSFSRLYRSEIIDMYCDNYTVEKIDLILEDIGEYELEKQEIEDYGIRTEEESEEL